jgi:hypothetical protein
VLRARVSSSERGARRSCARCLTSAASLVSLASLSPRGFGRGERPGALLP